MWREGLLCYAMYGLEARKRAAVIWLQRLKVTLVPRKNSTIFWQWKTEVLCFLYFMRFAKVTAFTASTKKALGYTHKHILHISEMGDMYTNYCWHDKAGLLLLSWGQKKEKNVVGQGGKGNKPCILCLNAALFLWWKTDNTCVCVCDVNAIINCVCGRLCTYFVDTISIWVFWMHILHLNVMNVYFLFSPCMIESLLPPQQQSEWGTHVCLSLLSLIV